MLSVFPYIDETDMKAVEDEGELVVRHGFDALDGEAEDILG
jgi:hypothetical protein